MPNKEDKKPLVYYAIIMWLGLFMFAYLAGGAGDETGIIWLKSNTGLLQILMFISIVGATIYDIFIG